MRKTSLRVGFRCEESPIGSGPYGNDRVCDAGVIKQVLLDRDTALLLIHLRAGFTPAEPDIEIAHPFIKDVAIKSRLDFPIPYRLGVQMKIAAEPTGQDDAARELTPQLCRYCQPVFVIELAFEVIHEYMPRSLRTRVPLMQVSFLISGFVCFGGYPLVSTNLTIIPTITHWQYLFMQCHCPPVDIFHIFVEKPSLHQR